MLWNIQRTALVGRKAAKNCDDVTKAGHEEGYISSPWSTAGSREPRQLSVESGPSGFFVSFGDANLNVNAFCSKKLTYLERMWPFLRLIYPLYRSRSQFKLLLPNVHFILYRWLQLDSNLNALFFESSTKILKTLAYLTFHVNSKSLLVNAEKCYVANNCLLVKDKCSTLWVKKQTANSCP